MSDGDLDKTQGAEAVSDAEWGVISRGRPAGRVGSVPRKYASARRSDLPNLVPVAIAHTFLPRETLAGPIADEQLYEARLTIDFAWKPGGGRVFSWTESYPGILASEKDEAKHATSQAMREWLHKNYRQDWRETWLGQWL